MGSDPSFHAFIDRVHKQLLAVHTNIERAKAVELVFAVQRFQANAPRGKWKRKPKRGRPALYRSILIDAKARHPNVYTEHQGAEILEEGGVVRSGARWLPVPILGRTLPFGRSGYFALPERGGQRAIVHHRRGGVFGVFKRQVFIRRTGWQTRSRAEIERSRRDEVILDAVFRG